MKKKIKQEFVSKRLCHYLYIETDEKFPTSNALAGMFQEKHLQGVQ